VPIFGAVPAHGEPGERSEMNRPDDVAWRRREELRSLLRALRSRRGGNGRKRLRQDQAAILSGLSTRRYAALERGAVENPSLDLIENVASGLRMTPAERSALHVLSRGQDPPMPPAAPGGERREVAPGQRELIDRLDAPAAITDETWTLVTCNKPLTAWTDGWFDRVPPSEQNLALFLFTPIAARLLTDIHACRRAVVAGLRYQYVRHIGSERFGAVIRTLLETGPEARDLWERHEIVLPRRHSAIQVRHRLGTVESSTLMISLSPRTWLMAAWLPEGLQPPGC
jgi:transcriptional regulator with XRE-family HTH domain